MGCYKIIEILDRKPEIPVDKGIKLPNLRGAISLKDLSFAYPSRKEKLVLENINIDFPVGKRIALVGTTGCGKSSIIQIIERFYDPQKG